MSEQLSYVVQHALEISIYASTTVLGLLCVAAGLAGVIRTRHVAA